MIRPFLLALLLLGPVAPASADRLDDIRRHGALRVAVSDERPPFAFFDPLLRQRAGLDIDVARAVAARLGVRLELLPARDEAEALRQLAGRADLAAATLGGATGPAAASLPYFADGLWFATRGNAPKSPELLRGEIGLLDAGGAPRARAGALRFEAFDNTRQALAAWRGGRLRALAGDAAGLADLLAALSEPERARLEIAPFQVAPVYRAFALAPGEERLAREVNEALLDLERQGGARRIHDDWVGARVRWPLPRDFRIGERGG